MRYRGLPVLALIGAVLLLVLGATSVATERANDDAVRDQDLASAAQAEAAALQSYFARSRDIVLLTANNPAVPGFYADPRPRSQKIATSEIRNVVAALGYLEQLYPGAIGEACFIDAAGPENARMVRGAAASPPNLSPDESKAIFFAPTLALTPGQVYAAPPYRSPDTGEWVISNSTPVVDPAGRKVGLVHYEVTIESFRRAIAASVSTAMQIDVVDRRTGAVVIDGDRPQVRAAPLGAPDLNVFRPLRGTVETAGTRSLDGVRTAYRAVDRDDIANANDWIVVASAPAPGLLSGAGVGALAIVSGASALLLLVAAVVALRRSRRLEAVALQRAMTARRAAEERSRTDALTGLLNRRGCVETLAAELRRGEREAHRPGVLLVDADRFKRINDVYGHAAGDAVLVELARRLRSAVREYDTVARWGGEEFCVIVPAVDDEAALRRIGETIRSVVAAAPIGGGPAVLLPVTVSVGAVCAGESLWSVEGLVDSADRALYAAKRRGRDQVRLFTEMTVEDFVAEEPEALRLAQALALSAAVREGMPELHSEHVADLSGAMATLLGLDEGMVLRCRLGGWLHDVGKVAIPDAILAKRSPLEDDEWAIMRSHAEVGEEIIRRVAGLAEASGAVRHHHERWDGNGYPDGLHGEEIPIEARVVAVADAFSAITADRPYQRGRSRDAAVVELRASAGSHLDPTAVEALIAVLEEHDRTASERLSAAS